MLNKTYGVALHDTNNIVSRAVCEGNVGVPWTWLESIGPRQASNSTYSPRTIFAGFESRLMIKVSFFGSVSTDLVLYSC